MGVALGEARRRGVVAMAKGRCHLSLPRTRLSHDRGHRVERGPPPRRALAPGEHRCREVGHGEGTQRKVSPRRAVESMAVVPSSIMRHQEDGGDIDEPPDSTDGRSASDKEADGG